MDHVRARSSQGGLPVSVGRVAFDVADMRALADATNVLAGGNCDFCASGEPAYRYPARAAYLGTLSSGGDQRMRVGALGAWRACEECSDLVEAGDWPALARRSYRTAGLEEVVRASGTPGLRVRVLAMLHHAHDGFKAARCGPRERIP